MKKILAFTFAILMLVSLTACKRNNVTVEHGNINGKVYTNEAAKITFTRPDNWTFAKDSALLAFSESQGLYKRLSSEAQNEILNNSGLAFDMMCISSEDEACSIGLMFANTNFSEIKDYTFEDIIYNMTGGLDISSTKKSTVTLGTEEYEKYSISSANQQTGEPVYASFYGREDGNIIYIIVASYNKTVTDKEIENCFS